MNFYQADFPEKTFLENKKYSQETEKAGFRVDR